MSATTRIEAANKIRETRWPADAKATVDDWAPAAGNVSDTILDALTFVGRITMGAYDDQRAYDLHQYRHEITRRTLTLDEHGNCYRLRINPATGSKSVRGITYPEALAELGLRENGGTR